MKTIKVNAINEFIQEFNQEVYKHCGVYINGALVRGHGLIAKNDTLYVLYDNKFVVYEKQLQNIKDLGCVAIAGDTIIEHTWVAD